VQCKNKVKYVGAFPITPTNFSYSTTVPVHIRAWEVEEQLYIFLTFALSLDEWLTVHHSITLVDLQPDAYNSCLFTYNTFIKILYMFRALPCPSSGGLRRNYIYAASGIVTLCR